MNAEDILKGWLRKEFSLIVSDGAAQSIVQSLELAAASGRETEICVAGRDARAGIPQQILLPSEYIKRVFTG